MPTPKCAGVWFAVFFAGATACSSDDHSHSSAADSGTPDAQPGAGGGGGSGGSTTVPDSGPKPDSGPATTTVTLADGVVEGDDVGGAWRFLKIPYAKPPVGNLRWAAPVKEDPWTGVRHETTFATGCPQNASSQGGASTTEDCLYLNVWAPEPLPKNAPVMVWFHGGGNFAGSAGDKLPVPSLSADQAPLWYDGQFFAKRHGVVLVTTNYRLGPMGFFSLASLGKEGSPLGNQGLLDQRRVLGWVQENIATFGGDTKNVTIFGESAGSADVCYHVASGVTGLFERAVSESGGCTVSIGGGKDPTAAESQLGMNAFTKALGCDAATDPLACLRGKSATDIMANAQQPDPSSGSTTAAPWTFAPVVDGPGGFLPDQARTLFDEGKIAKVPYILGSNNDEGTLFVLGLTVSTATDYQTQLEQRFGKLAADVAALYPVSNFGGNYGQALARVVGDSGLVCGTHDTARRAAKAGLDVFMYNFNIPWAIAPTVLLVSHASEIGHVFGDPWMPDASSQAVSDAMNQYWSTFAKTGDPNGAGAPATWPAFAPTATDDDKRLQLDSGWETLTDFRKPECAFWRKAYDAAYAGTSVDGGAPSTDAGVADAQADSGRP